MSSFLEKKRREKCVTFRYHHQIPNSISRPCVILSAGRVRVEKELSSPYHDLSKSWLDYRNENCIYAHEYKLGLMRDTWLATPHRLFQSFSLSLFLSSLSSPLTPFPELRILPELENEVGGIWLWWLLLSQDNKVLIDTLRATEVGKWGWWVARRPFSRHIFRPEHRVWRSGRLQYRADLPLPRMYPDLFLGNVAELWHFINKYFRGLD